MALPDVKVVVTPGLGRRDPQFSPHCPNEYCLTVTEGTTATYTVRNYIVPRPGEPITVTPQVIEGTGVTVTPASVSWTSVDDFQELATFTVAAAHDTDAHARDSSFRIGHDFSDNYITDGRLEDGEDRNEAWFNLAGTVVDDDKLTLSVTPVGDGDTILDEISLNSNADGTASFEVRLSGPLVDCAGRDYPEDCAESLFVKLQTVVSRTRVPGRRGRDDGHPHRERCCAHHPRMRHARPPHWTATDAARPPPGVPQPDSPARHKSSMTVPRSPRRSTVAATTGSCAAPSQPTTGPPLSASIWRWCPVSAHQAATTLW